LATDEEGWTLLRVRATAKLPWRTQESFIGKEKMINYVSFLLEASAAKRRVGQLFESEMLGRADHLSTAIISCDSNHAIRTNEKQNNKAFREQLRAHRLVRDRISTVLAIRQPSQVKRDLTMSSFVLVLVLVGVLLAASTDRPVFWLLIGPAPLAALHTLRTFLRQGPKRPADYPGFTNGIDDIPNLS
jgi:hypothetical protein